MTKDTYNPLTRLRRALQIKQKRMESRFIRTLRGRLAEDLEAFSMEYFLRDRMERSEGKGTYEGPARSHKIIVSLTTIPPRLFDLGTTIESLLHQTMKPDTIVLWLNQDKVRLDELPLSLRGQMGRGLDVRLCEDIGPHTKLIPALKAFPDDIIITVDDDTLYPDDLVERLVLSYRRNPEVIHCARARLIATDKGRNFEYGNDWPCLKSSMQGLDVLPLGVGGVLYPPKILHEDVFDLEKQKLLAPKADDIWFKTMSLRKKVECKRISVRRQPAPLRPYSQDVTLNKVNIDEGGNEAQTLACFDHYRLWNLFGKSHE